MSILTHQGDTCPVEITPDGTLDLCDRPATRWAWYDGGDHEPMLMQVCPFHETDGAQAIADLLAERDALRVRVARLEARAERHEAEDLQPGTVGLLSMVTHERDRLAEDCRVHLMKRHEVEAERDRLRATVARVEALADEWLRDYRLHADPWIGRDLRDALRRR